MLNYEDLVMSAQFNYSRFYPIYAAESEENGILQ